MVRCATSWTKSCTARRTKQRPLFQQPLIAIDTQSVPQRPLLLDMTKVYKKTRCTSKRRKSRRKLSVAAARRRLGAGIFGSLGKVFKKSGRWLGRQAKKAGRSLGKVAKGAWREVKNSGALEMARDAAMNGVGMALGVQPPMDQGGYDDYGPPEEDYYAQPPMSRGGPHGSDMFYGEGRRRKKSKSRSGGRRTKSAGKKRVGGTGWKGAPAWMKGGTKRSGGAWLKTSEALHPHNPPPFMTPLSTLRARAATREAVRKRLGGMMRTVRF